LAHVQPLRGVADISGGIDSLEDNQQIEVDRLQVDRHDLVAPSARSVDIPALFII
jgi:hypothetical protein